jgi:SAM-dependent methyltransferase
MTRFGSLDFPSDVLAYLVTHGHDHASIAKYSARVEDDLHGIQPWLAAPHGLAKIWDIGCGLAGLTALLLRYDRTWLYCLTDGSPDAERRVGFKPDTKGSFDVEIAAMFVQANKAPSSAARVEQWLAGECTLAISLKSWGHHYPIGVYLDEVRQALAPGGRLIIDIRTGTDGADELCANGFQLVGKVLEKPKRRRLVFEREAA